MKRITILAVLAFLSVAAQGQQTTANSAVQSTNLALSNALEISFTGNSGIVDIDFASLNDLVNGVETASHQIKVSSNKKYKVTVRPASDNFTYAGSSLLGSLLKVSTVMKIKVEDNNTGGDRPWLAQILGWQSFSVLGLPVTLLTDCDAGNNQTFTVKYKATPGINCVAGNYNADMVYTATQQ